MCPDPDILWAPPRGGAVEAGRPSFLCPESSRRVLPLPHVLLPHHRRHWATRPGVSSSLGSAKRGESSQSSLSLP